MCMPFFKSHTCKYEIKYMFILASADLSLMKDTSPNSKFQMHQYYYHHRHLVYAGYLYIYS